MSVETSQNLLSPSTEFPFQLLFPAVTFCNHNRINCDRLKENLNTFDNDTNNILLELQNLACQDEPVPSTNIRKRRQTSSSSGMEPPPGETPSDLLAEYQFLDFFMSLNESVRRTIGHDFISFIKSCTFRGKDCTNIRFI